jgi:hypothetical protein
MLCKMDTLREFMTVFQEGLARVESDLSRSGGGSSSSGNSTPNEADDSSTQGPDA